MSTCSVNLFGVLASFLSLFSAVLTQEQLLEPAMNAVYEGNTALFNCSAHMYQSLQWTINNELVNFISEFEKNLSFGQLGGEWRFSLLELKTVLDHNNSVITCIANENLFQTASNQQIINSKLYVQGLPGQVLGFEGTNTSTAELQFTWSPPRHVPGIPECCNFYTLNISNIDSGDILINSTNFTQNMIVLNVLEQYLCSLYLVQISAHNDLGEGDIFEAKWSLGGYFEANRANYALYYNETELSLEVNVTIDGYCLNDLDNVSVTIKCDSNDKLLYKTNDIEVKRGQNVNRIQERIVISIPVTHLDTKCLFEVALENEVGLQGLRFRTHDVQMVRSSITDDKEAINGSVCVTCMYITNSPARGCVMTISHVNTEMEISFKNIPIGNTNENCMVLFKTGRFVLRVYDWQSDGSRGRVAVHNETFDVTITSVPTGPTPTSGSDSSRTDGLSPGGIVGISVGVVIAVLLVFVACILITVVLYFRHSNKDKSNVKSTSPLRIGTDGSKVKLLSGDEEIRSHDDLLKKLNDDVKSYPVKYTLSTDENGCKCISITPITADDN